MNQAIAIAKLDKDATSTNPNDFIFHSSYNSFKIIVEKTKYITHNGTPNTQLFAVEHHLNFIPLVSAFAKVQGESQVYPPNGYGVTAAGSKTLTTNEVSFDYVEADTYTIRFSFTTSSSKNIVIRYFCLEAI
jgi:hypothetical protein